MEIFVKDFALVLGFAFVITLLFRKIKQPVVLGYLVAGMLIGPHALGLVSSLGTINMLAELGIILLMFSLGLEFNFKNLMKFGWVVVTIGIAEMLLIGGIGNAIGRILGWTYTESIFLGGIIAISSSAIILKILFDMRENRKEHFPLIMGILIVEDIGAVFLLTLLGSLGMVGAQPIQDIITIVFRISVFFSVVLIFGTRYIPPFVDSIKETGSKEVLLLASLGLCFILAVFSDFLGFSVALGAFMMGSIISECRCIHDVKGLIGPVRDIFASMFFLTIGMLVNVLALKDFLFEIAFISLIAIWGKVAFISLGAYLAGYTGITALSTGLGMVPRGEFSFIIAKLGIDKGVIGPEFYLLAVGISIVTTLITPSSLSYSPMITSFISKNVPIQTKSFFKYFYAWVKILRGQFELESETTTKFKKNMKEMFVHASIIVLIFHIAIAGKRIFISPWPGLSLLAMTVASVLSLPSLYIIIRNTGMIVDLSIDIAGAKFKFPGLELIKTTIRNATYIATGLFFAVTMLPIIVAEAMGHGLLLDLSIFVFIAACGYLFWRTMDKFHDKLDKMISKIFDFSEKEIESIKGDREVGLEIVKVGNASPLIGKSILDARLRTLTGATILSIERGGKTIRNPSPLEKINAGDSILVMGTEEERENIRRCLG